MKQQKDARIEVRVSRQVRDDLEREAFASGFVTPSGRANVSKFILACIAMRPLILSARGGHNERRT